MSRRHPFLTSNERKPIILLSSWKFRRVGCSELIKWRIWVLPWMPSAVRLNVYKDIIQVSSITTKSQPSSAHWRNRLVRIHNRSDEPLSYMRAWLDTALKRERMTVWQLIRLECNWLYQLDWPNDGRTIFARRLNNSTVLIHTFRNIEGGKYRSGSNPNSRDGYVIPRAESVSPGISSTCSMLIWIIHDFYLRPNPKAIMAGSRIFGLSCPSLMNLSGLKSNGSG